MTVLAGAIGVSDAQIVVNATLTVGNYPAPYTIGTENIAVQGGSGSTVLSVLRGQNGTARSSHAAGVAITSGWYSGGGAPEPHATSHESGGSDEIDVTGLAGTVLSRTTILTNAQIIALPQTHVELVPAQGVGKFLILLGGTVVLDNSAGVYTLAEGADDPQLAVAYEGAAVGVASAYAGDGGFLTNPYPAGRAPIVPDVRIGRTGDYTGLPFTPVTTATPNMALVLKDDDNDGGSPYGGGDPANTLTVTVLYVVLDE